jgi:glycine/D-amino acid oxidase-like deaminating enzyme
MVSPPNTVILGAGIAGVSAAYYLSVHYGVKDVLLIDDQPPLSLTSDKSTECYRNWWPGPGDVMVRFMNHSIDLLEKLARESGNIFNLNRRGYLYLTANPTKGPEMLLAGQETASLGGGELRVHRGKSGDLTYIPSHPTYFEDQPGGADLILDPGMIKYYFPYISENTVAALHARRAGWFSAQQLGAYLLDQARRNGVQVLQDRIVSIATRSNRVKGVRLCSGILIDCTNLVIAAGPYLKEAGRMLGLDLPVYCELHLKVAFKDHLGIVPRHAPMLIWMDTQRLPWSEEEQTFLQADESTRWLLEEFPSGVHTRPEGGDDSPMTLMLWEYRTEKVEPLFPPPMDLDYPEIALRGLATMLPALSVYFGKAPRPVLDGGYYTKTRENRPLICPLPIEGTFVIGALSGYGLMASQAAGDLLARLVTHQEFPDYAPAFDLRRYDDPDYQILLERWGSSGQL